MDKIPELTWKHAEPQPRLYLTPWQQAYFGLSSFSDLELDAMGITVIETDGDEVYDG